MPFCQKLPGLTPVQCFVAEHIHAELEGGKRPSVLCAMGLGTGKTLVSIAAAEAAMSTDRISNAVVITRRALVQSFQNDLEKCGVRDLGKYTVVTFDKAARDPAALKDVKRSTVLGTSPPPSVRTVFFLAAVPCSLSQRHREGGVRRRTRGGRGVALVPRAAARGLDVELVVLGRRHEDGHQTFRHLA